MSLDTRSADELVELAKAGGGLRLHVSRHSVSDFVRIAAAAAKGNSQLFLIGAGSLQRDVLLEIATAGKGAVIFEDDPLPLRGSPGGPSFAGGFAPGSGSSPAGSGGIQRR